MNLENKYLLDTVSISKLSKSELESLFVQENCKIPEEIFYECSGFNKIQSLAGIVLPVTMDLLKTLQTIVQQLDDEDKIIDLFNNEGNGDVILITTALHEMSKTIELFRTNWIIVTDDRLLAERASEFNIETCSTEEFRLLLRQKTLSDEAKN